MRKKRLLFSATSVWLPVPCKTCPLDVYVYHACPDYFVFSLFLSQKFNQTLPSLSSVILTNKPTSQNSQISPRDTTAFVKHDRSIQRKVIISVIFGIRENGFL